MPVHQPAFDPSQDFVATKFFRFDGVIYSRGDPFLIAGLPERKAKQLYESRHIGYADATDRPRFRYGRNREPKATTPRPAARSIGDLIAGFFDAVARHPRPEGFNQLNADAAAPTGQPEPVVDAEAEAAARDELIKRLQKRFNREALLKEAEGLELPEEATKAQIAEALVNAGRGNGPA